MMHMSPFSLLALDLAPVSTAASLEPRQSASAYGYWDASLSTKGTPVGTWEGLEAPYVSGGQSVARSCRISEWRGVETRTCDPGFDYSWGPPFGKSSLPSKEIWVEWRFTGTLRLMVVQSLMKVVLLRAR